VLLLALTRMNAAWLVGAGALTGLVTGAIAR